MTRDELLPVQICFSSSEQLRFTTFDHETNINVSSILLSSEYEERGQSGTKVRDIPSLLPLHLRQTKLATDEKHSRPAAFS